MVDDLTKAFGRRIDALAWMTPETKAEAKAKVATLYVGVGYPDKWIDYGPLQIARDDAIGNVAARRAVRIPASARQARTAGRPDRVVDDAADGERGQPAAAERARTSPPRSCRSRTSIRRATPPRTTAPSARRSATRSATASTTSAASSTPRAGSPTGGRRRISSTSSGRRGAGGAVRRLPAVPGPGDQRAPGAQREHRRSRRPGRGLRRLPPVAERPAGQRSRLLRRLRPELARQGARGGDPRSRSRPTATRRTTTAPPPSATSTRGTRRSSVTPAQKMYLPPDKRVRVW